MHDELAHLLQRAEWRSNFDERTLERARGYARDGSVTKLRGHVEDGTHVLTAQVDGSRGERYVCRVTVSDHDKWLIVDTRCSCPVGVDCKHAAAMLMVVAGEGAGDGEACRTEPVGHAAHRRRLALSFRRERRPSPQTERPSCLPIGVEARLRILRPPRIKSGAGSERRRVAPKSKGRRSGGFDFLAPQSRGHPWPLPACAC